MWGWAFPGRGLPLPEVRMRMDWEGWRRQLWGGTWCHGVSPGPCRKTYFPKLFVGWWGPLAAEMVGEGGAAGLVPFSLWGWAGPELGST